MSPGKANQRIITDRLGFVAGMIKDIQLLPLTSLSESKADSRNVAAAESCIRRALEALLDVGRHILSKVFGSAVTEYKQVAKELENRNVLSGDPARKLITLAGYRNRMVHFYHEITEEELYSICTLELGDLIAVRNALADWVTTHPESINSDL